MELRVAAPGVAAAAAALLLAAGCGPRKPIPPASASAAGPAATPATVKVVFAATPPGGVASLPLWKPDPALVLRLGPTVPLEVGAAKTPYVLHPPKGFPQEEIAHSTESPLFRLHPPGHPTPTILVSIRKLAPGTRPPRVQAVLVEEMVRRLHTLPAHTRTLEPAEVGRSVGGWEWARIRFRTASEAPRSERHSTLYAAVDIPRGRLIVATISDAGKESLPLLEAAVLTLRVGETAPSSSRGKNLIPPATQP